jgi:hypothetical protein
MLTVAIARPPSTYTSFLSFFAFSIYMRIPSQPPLCIVYLCVHDIVFLFSRVSYECTPYDTVCHDTTRHDTP